MSTMRGAFLTAVAFAGAGCAGSTSPASPVVLTASPSSYAFALNETAPKAITVSRSVGSFSSVTAATSDSTRFGTSISSSGGTAIVSVLPVSSAGGSPTTLTVTDGSGAYATVSLVPALCGRPDNLDYRSQLIAPLPGATGVPTNLGTLYSAVYSQVAPVGTKVHLSVAATNATLEGGPLQVATPPPGSATPAPIAGPVETTMIATIPALPSGSAIRTQLYDDPCEGAILTGTLTT